MVMASTHALLLCEASSTLSVSSLTSASTLLKSRQSIFSRGSCDGGSGREGLVSPISCFNRGVSCASHSIQQNKLTSSASTFLAGTGLALSQRPETRKCSIKTHARLAQEKKQKLAFEPKKASSTFDEIDSVAKEPHKYFDQAVISVKAGEGGNGTLIKKTKKRPAGKGQKQKPRGKAKRGLDGEIQLPMGGGGGDIVLYADPSLETLLEFHRKKKFQGGRGGNVDATLGLGADLLNGMDAPELRVPVPVGTVIKKKRGGAFIADLTKPGAEIRVACGGRGGISILEASQQSSGEGDVVTSSDEKVLLTGTPGEEVKLELTLRVVADLGLVGLPNAGKSSLLKAVSQAKPDIADYPFTTLMPNLGRMAGDPLSADGGAEFGATMADLPGLIEGAHVGRGLGRMFLRHLRRTRLLVHVVDASNPDPLKDFLTLREELRMYNPDYLKRPYIIVLNKIDRPEASAQWEAVRNRLVAGAYRETENGADSGGTEDGADSGGIEQWADSRGMEKTAESGGTLTGAGSGGTEHGAESGAVTEMPSGHGNAAIGRAGASEVADVNEKDPDDSQDGADVSREDADVIGEDADVSSEGASGASAVGEEFPVWDAQVQRAKEDGGWPKSERNRNGKEAESQRKRNGLGAEAERKRNGNGAETERKRNGSGAESHRKRNEIRAEPERKRNGSGAEPEEGRNAAPKAVLGISAREGLGISEFLKAVREALREDERSPVLQSERRRERSQLIKSPSWTL